ncbi:MAG: hypothetical protein SFV81_09990, partial [Pirellulaceae bacterium]|nr:hypothetical protein [Pirellulaceae bacterium]
MLLAANAWPSRNTLWWVAPAGCDQRPCPVQMVALGESNPPISLRLSLVHDALSSQCHQHF